MMFYIAISIGAFIVSAILFGIWCAIAKTVYDVLMKKR